MTVDERCGVGADRRDGARSAHQAGAQAHDGGATGLWEAIRIAPQKWQQNPYGDQSGGFWVVGLIGQTVVWYNDIEDGFNRSRFSTFGTIDDYWCNQDELEVTLQYLLSALEQGSDLVRLMRDWTPQQR